MVQSYRNFTSSMDQVEHDHQIINFGLAKGFATLSMPLSANASDLMTCEDPTKTYRWDLDPCLPVNDRAASLHPI